VIVPNRLNRPDRLQMTTRYVLILLWEFRWSLLVFTTLVLGGGFLLFQFYHSADGRRIASYGEACYAVFLAIFLESYLEFPGEWYLQPLFFLLPVIGLGAVADSLVRLAYLMFSRKQSLPEWQRMVASLYRDHHVVVGAGKVGYEIVKGLLTLREPVVAVERLETSSPLIDELMTLKVPIIRGDGRYRKTLEEAGVTRAKAVVLATSDDLANLDAGLTARDVNPRVRIVLRLFDETLASKVQGAFAMPAISTSRVSAPAFIAAATGRRMYQEFKLGGQLLHIVDLHVNAECPLVGKTVGEMQSDRRINIVMHRGAEGVCVNPAAEVVIAPGDDLLVIAPIEQVLELEAMNQVDLGEQLKAATWGGLPA
jgi:Trk K+ transport system NAD-binding subunit